MYIHLKSCWLTHFQLFAWFGKIIFVKKILTFAWATIAPKKLIFSDQVGFGPGFTEEVAIRSAAIISYLPKHKAKQ